MILDIRERLNRYICLAKGFDEAISFLSRNDLDDLPEGRHEIAGDDVYAVVAREKGRKEFEAQLETHNRYIDIQLVLKGSESMGWKPRSACKHPAAPYDSEKDLSFYTDTPDAFIPVNPGAFAIFFPEDAHMPLIGDGMIHKIIVKIKV